MAQVPCGARIGFLVAAIIFVIVQMRLFAAEQKYALQATSSVEYEEDCQTELRELGDKLLTQQTKLAFLEGEKIRLERENGKLVSELETSQRHNFTGLILFENAQRRMFSQGTNKEDTVNFKGRVRCPRLFLASLSFWILTFPRCYQNVNAVLQSRVCHTIFLTSLQVKSLRTDLFQA